MTKKSLELTPLQNTILVRIGTAERMELERLVRVISARGTLTAAERGHLEEEIRLQVHLMSIYGLIDMVTGYGNTRTCVASQRLREWLPEHLQAAAAEGETHRPSILLPIAFVGAMAVSGCASMGDSFSSWGNPFASTNKPAPVVAPYNAEGVAPPERMEQFRDPRGNLVYRFCVGNECPQPTPKVPAVKRLPVTTEIGPDGLPVPPERPTLAAAVVTAPAADKPAAKTVKNKPVAKPLPKLSHDPAANLQPVPATKKVETKAAAQPAPEATQKAEVPTTPPSGSIRSESIHTTIEGGVAAFAVNPDDGQAAGAVLSPDTFVAGWAAYWSLKDTDVYFSLYADNFKPSSGQRAKDWMEARGAIIKRAKQIDVNVDNFKVIRKDDRASVTFRQSYNSNRFKSSVIKRLDLVLIDGHWKILREVVLSDPTAA